MMFTKISGIFGQIGKTSYIKSKFKTYATTVSESGIKDLGHP